MDISINTVKSHLRRAKEELKQILKEGDLNE
jgi:DNA-directed RNA polymerase specialized sigma24 family protein